MLRRLVCTAAASVAVSTVALGTVAPAASADAFASTSTVPLTQFTRLAQIAPLAPITGRAPLPLPLPEEREGRGGREGGLKAQDAFTVTVAGLKTKAAPATYQLRCGLALRVASAGPVRVQPARGAGRRQEGPVRTGGQGRAVHDAVRR